MRSALAGRDSALLELSWHLLSAVLVPRRLVRFGHRGVVRLRARESTEENSFVNWPESHGQAATVGGGGGHRRRATAFGLVVALLAALVAVISSPQAAVAAGNQEGVGGYANNTILAYLQAGESLYTEGNIGTITETDGSTHSGPGTFGPAETAGVWRVQLPTQGVNTAYDWTVEVRAGGAEVPGRVWAAQDVIHQSLAGGELADLQYWIVNNTGYVYAVELGGYNGGNSTIQANSVGWADENCAPTYASYEYALEGPGGNLPPLPDCGETYRVFYEEPAADLPVTAPSAVGDVTILPELLAVGDLEVTDLAFAPAATGAAAGTFTYSLNPRFTGGYFLQVDVDGNGSYTDAVDRSIALGADGSGSYSYAFDGLDGTGAEIEDCTTLTARIFFDKLGEVHIAQTDVEAREGGISITRLNGEGAPDPTIHWNDEGFEGTRVGTTTPIVGESVDSTDGVHAWPLDDNGWGNGRIIDDWAYIPADFGTGEIQIAGRCLSVDKTSDASETTRVGDTVNYTVEITNTGDTDYTEDEPAVAYDDLSGVLDDATYNDDVTSTSGEVSYIEPTFLRWSGPLAAGETVTLDYSVTLTPGGDGGVRNVAWAPLDPPEPGDPPANVPECDPRDADGRDPVTGEPCGPVNYQLPRLTITKTSDVQELPADGGQVTYTVTITNEGPGATTAEDDPVVDDLSEVLDDATFVTDSESADTGTVAVDTEAAELSWTGGLAAGASAELSYQVTYDAQAVGGDHELLNVVCLPEHLALDPADACRQVNIPGAALDQWKTSDPESGTSVVEGDVVTYTLHFANTGQAAAAVDTFDDLSNVLDDADLVEGSLSADDGLTATIEGEQVTVTGSVPVGETLTVSYQVLVREFEDQGDHILANLLDCADDDPRCATQHPVRHLVLDKSSDPTEGVDLGDTVTYTITVTNDGEGDYTEDVPASITDDLSGVLDDADYNGDVTVSLSAGSAAADPVVDGETLTWTGPLQAGEVATITYSVTVTTEGDNELANVVCETGTEVCAETSILLPDVTFAKSSDPDSGADVVAGQVITYTLTYTNDGQAAGVVDSVDDLTELLDDGDITAEPVSSSDAVTATLLPDSIRVVGPIEPGETVTVIYEVTVKPDGERGDHELINVLVPDNPNEPPVPPVDHRTPELVDWKSVDPASGTTVQPGAEVVYTLHFRNDGAAPAEVDREDVLTGVLDDATITVDPVASDDALSTSSIEDERFAITGALAPGQLVTVTYTATVNADGERGDDQLGNFLVDSGEEPPAECVVVEGELPDCTVHHVSNVVVAKSSDPASGTEVIAGEEVTYTLTFTNVSTNTASEAAEVDYTDHLVDVLDDAELTGGPQSSDEALTVTSAEESIRIVGALSAADVVTVTYTVTVADYDEQGDHRLANVVAPTGQDPVCAPGSDLCTEHPVPPPAGGSLPETGAGEIGIWVLAAIGALGAGVLLVEAGRRRNGRIRSEQSTSSTI